MLVVIQTLYNPFQNNENVDGFDGLDRKVRLTVTFLFIFTCSKIVIYINESGALCTK